MRSLPELDGLWGVACWKEPESAAVELGGSAGDGAPEHAPAIDRRRRAPPIARLVPARLEPTQARGA
jgi:hypothetical protein